MIKPIRAHKILLVDDEPSIIKMVGKRLEVEGYQLAVAMDGEEALAKIKAAPPDLIILDLMLPKISGLDVCATLKEDEVLRTIPVIAYTGRGQTMDELSRACGADALVHKGAGIDALLAEVRKHLP